MENIVFWILLVYSIGHPDWKPFQAPKYYSSKRLCIEDADRVAKLGVNVSAICKPKKKGGINAVR